MFIYYQFKNNLFSSTGEDQRDFSDNNRTDTYNGGVYTYI
jgi:hypothetical protein